MTFNSIIRANPKFLEATDLDIKKQENEEKAKLNNIGQEVIVEEEDITEEENKEE